MGQFISIYVPQTTIATVQYPNIYFGYGSGTFINQGSSAPASYNWYPWSGGNHVTNTVNSTFTQNGAVLGDNRVYIVSGLYGVNNIDSANLVPPRPTARLILRG